MFAKVFASPIELGKLHTLDGMGRQLRRDSLKVTRQALDGPNDAGTVEFNCERLMATSENCLKLIGPSLEGEPVRGGCPFAEPWPFRQACLGNGQLVNRTSNAD